MKKEAKVKAKKIEKESAKGKEDEKDKDKDQDKENEKDKEKENKNSNLNTYLIKLDDELHPEAICKFKRNNDLKKLDVFVYKNPQQDCLIAYDSIKYDSFNEKTGLYATIINYKTNSSQFGEVHLKIDYKSLELPIITEK